MEHMLNYWRQSLVEAEAQLKRETIKACAEITRQRIANYRKWIARAEGMAQ